MAPGRKKKTNHKEGDFKINVDDVLSIRSGRYRIEKFVGGGSFGKVARCVKLGSDEKIAVKFVYKKMVWAAKREVAMLRKLISLDLNKNNLVRFIEDFEYGGHFCLAFEMLDISLWDLMKERSFKPLHLSEIRIITQQLLIALKALKSIGLVHADIKEDNVMLVNHRLQPFKLKLIDFGVANIASLMQCGTVCQIICYRAPEVTLGLPLGEAIDMWALGCILAFTYLGKTLHPGSCEYTHMKTIVQMHGQPDDQLLNSGLYTTNFFSKIQYSSSPSWRLKTRTEYELATGSVTKPDTNVFSSLDDLLPDDPPHAATYEDTKAFVSLLKRMLHADLKKRITPREALGHRFITMKHFPSAADNNPYTTSAHLTTEKSLVEHFVTSSEIISWIGACKTSLDDPLSVDDESTAGKPQAMARLHETRTAGPVYRPTAAADGTAAGKNNRPPGTYNVVSPASVRYCSRRMSSRSQSTSDKETSIKVKAQEHFGTSSKTIRWNGASTTSSDDPLSNDDESAAAKTRAVAGLDETCTAGTIYSSTATADRTVAGKNNRPPATYEVRSHIAANYNSIQISGMVQSDGDEETSGSVKVQAQNSFRRRTFQFFSRMKQHINCCSVDEATQQQQHTHTSFGT